MTVISTPRTKSSGIPKWSAEGQARVRELIRSTAPGTTMQVKFIDEDGPDRRNNGCTVIGPLAISSGHYWIGQFIIFLKDGDLVVDLASVEVESRTDLPDFFDNPCLTSYCPEYLGVITEDSPVLCSGCQAAAEAPRRVFPSLSDAAE